MTMIERMARAIADDEVEGWEYETVPDFWKAKARAAIAAMREPDYEMLAKGRDQDRANEIETRKAFEETMTLTYRTENVGRIWQAMIDAALKERG